MRIICLLLLLVVTSTLGGQVDKAVKYLLPTSVRPTHYELSFNTFLEKCRQSPHQPCLYTAEARIDINVLEPVSNIILHSYHNIQIEKVLLAKKNTFPNLNSTSYGGSFFKRKKFINAETGSHQVTITKYEDDTNKLILKVEPVLQEGDYQLLFKFRAYHGKDNKGFYLVKAEQHLGGKHVLSTAFEPTSARSAFPCFDEPQYKTTYRIMVTIDKSLAKEGYHVLSNAPLDFKAKLTVNNNYSHVGYLFEKTAVPMSTYLVAMVVSDYALAFNGSFTSTFSGKNQTKPFRTWVPKIYLEDHSLRDSQSLGPFMMQFFTKLYGIGYADQKIDQISIPSFKMGAMENWGLVTYKEKFILTDKANSTINEFLQGITVMAHELAHQWFGNLVTIDSWRNLWITEGFASLNEPFYDKSPYKMTNLGNAAGRQLTERALPAMHLDQRPDTKALSSPAYSPKEIQAKFNAGTYGKGGAMLRMWMHSLGKKVFFNGLKNYLKENALGIGSPEKLFDCWTREHAKNLSSPTLPAAISELFTSWYQKPGFPLLIVNRTDTKLTITQERFSIPYKGQLEHIAAPSEWYIPITYSTSEEVRHNITMPDTYIHQGRTTAVINLNKVPEWYTLNNQAVGFYRVLYDEANIEAIIRVLHNPDTAKLIHPFNRASLLDDTMSICMMHRPSPFYAITTPFKLMCYIRTETDFVPWRAFKSILMALLTVTKTKPELHNTIMKFGLKLYHDGLVNAQQRPNDTVEGQLLLEELLTGPQQILKHSKSHKSVTRSPFGKIKPPKFVRSVISKQEDILIKFIDDWLMKNHE